jgi:probable O-glycosylation ligase (exosortase A-associated)
MNRSSPTPSWQRRPGRWQPFVVLILLCVAIGLVMLKVPWFFIAAGLVALLVALAIVAEPFYGVLLYLVLLYVRPGDMFPPLEPLRLTLLGVALLTGAYVLQVLVYRKVKPMFSRPMLWMVLFFGVMLASFPGSFYKTATMDKILEVVRIVYMTYLIVHLVDTLPRVRKFMFTMVLIMGGLSTTIVLRYFLFPETRQVYGGGSGGIAGGFLGDGNDYALAQNVILPWAIALYSTASRATLKLALLYAILIGALAVAVTFSRGGFMGLVAVLGSYYLLWVVRNRAFARGVLYGFILLTVSVVAFMAFAPEQFRNRIESVSEYEEDESAQGRLDAWGAALRMVQDHPIFGVGAGAFTTAYGTKYFPHDATAQNWREAHSVLFQTMGELGLAGLVALYGMFLSILFLAYRLRNTVLPFPRDNQFFHAARAAVIVSLAGWFVTSMFLSVAYYPHLFLLVMVATTLERLAIDNAFELPEIVEVEEVDEDT